MLNDTLRELGSRVVQARQQGQEAAELKKSGEISVLEKELGSKSKYSSCILIFRMTDLHCVCDVIPGP